MKLAEALIERADLQKRLAQMSGRITSNLIVQEGEEPSEKPSDLFVELDTYLKRLEYLIRSINHTNLTAKLPKGKSLTDALAERDVLQARISAYRSAVDGTSGGRFNRYSMTEIKDIRTVNVKELREFVDRLSQEYRELDTAIQATNWTTDLV